LLAVGHKNVSQAIHVNAYASGRVVDDADQIAGVNVHSGLPVEKIQDIGRCGAGFTRRLPPEIAQLKLPAKTKLPGCSVQSSFSAFCPTRLPGSGTTGGRLPFATWIAAFNAGLTCRSGCYSCSFC
jgi:hypothetical protein